MQISTVYMENIHIINYEIFFWDNRAEDMWELEMTSTNNNFSTEVLNSLFVPPGSPPQGSS